MFQAIEKKFDKTVDTDSKVDNAYLLVHSDSLNLHLNLARVKIGDVPATPEQPFHTASIGKTFTAVLIAMLVEKGKISYEDRVATFLPAEMVQGLHVYKGTDYSEDLSIWHLLSNTSGLPDYYELKPKKGPSFQELLFHEPSRFWTPEETIEWTKQHLTPKFAPGKGCHYSNTGFNLLGLIIEKVTGRVYQEVLHEYIFGPLGMKHTYLCHYSEPAVASDYPVATVYMNDKRVNVTEHKSFSSIYAGGQTVSTSEDLLLFMKALVGGQLVSQESLAAMQKWTKMWLGVEYGLGLMRVRMQPFTEKYNVWGHLGSTGSFMLYNPGFDVYVIGSFNRTGYVGKSIRFVYSILRKIAKVAKK
ncbi:serine hydrolase [Bacillus sp. SORGH_AS_0510]|uniref:serine hydrolase domain-containing protein n=1 Tax=Bacillus sp. SORGH_AS_0510 TaxID=3041771 RepID=UPI0027D82BA8|nr:serine hydrolase domain-containing protein [Bacillus sp. SORGH_AS_0510]